MDNTKLKHITGFIPSAVVLTYIYLGSQSFLLPQKQYQIAQSHIKSDYKYNPYYTLLSDQEIIKDQIETIHNFVTNLLENMQDLDPQYSKLVDEHFWELA